MRGPNFSSLMEPNDRLDNTVQHYGSSLKCVVIAKIVESNSALNVCAFFVSLGASSSAERKRKSKSFTAKICHSCSPSPTSVCTSRSYDLHSIVDVMRRRW